MRLISGKMRNISQNGGLAVLLSAELYRPTGLLSSHRLLYVNILLIFMHVD